MAYIKGDDPEEQKYFDFLEDLRQSGDTNMFGASPYLQRAFGLDDTEAHAILGRWMRFHDDKSRVLAGPSTQTKRTVKIEQKATLRIAPRAKGQKEGM